MVSKGFPNNVTTSGQQYNIGEKPSVILYTYINLHACCSRKFEIEKSGESDNGRKKPCSYHNINGRSNEDCYNKWNLDIEMTGKKVLLTITVMTTQIRTATSRSCN